MEENTQYDYSVAIIVVTDTEFNATKYMYDDWKEFTVEGDSQVYYQTQFSRDGKSYKVVCGKQDEMGMTAAAVLSMKLIQNFKPRYLIMLGIAAGVAQEDFEIQQYGDVVAPDVIWNYSAGKFVSPEKSDIRFGTVGFVPRPTVVEMPEEIVSYLNAAKADIRNQCHVFVGPLASGSAVVANSEIVASQIHTQFQKTAGLDMEAYAVAYAAKNALDPKPMPIVLKSVCDFADSRKSDQYQKFAAYTSCEFGKFLYENYLPL